MDSQYFTARKIFLVRESATKIVSTFFSIEKQKQEFFAMGIRYENSFNFFDIEKQKQEFFAMGIR